MNNKNTLGLFICCAALLVFLFGFTRPSLHESWLIVIFFVIYYGFIYLGVSLLAAFLAFKPKSIRKISLLAASVAVAMQILVTFNALRPLELVLMATVFMFTGWYVSKAKS